MIGTMVRVLSCATIRPSPFQVSALAALLGAALLTSKPAQAFSEDICYRYVDPKSQSGDVIPKAFNCWNIQCTDSPRAAPPASQCVVAGLAKYLNATLARGLHGRDMVHFDALYLYARMHGLSEEDAFAAASYSQATDLGVFTHNGADGKVISGSQSDNLQGIVRTNFSTLGFSMHFVTWLQGSDHATSSKLTYQRDYASQKLETPFPVQEATINHLRTWAFGRRDTVCQFGLTQNQSDLSAPCFNENAPTMYTSYSALGGDKGRIEPSPIALSWQRIRVAEHCDGKDEDECYDQSYATKIHGSPKSLGIYLHVMGDRLSHSYCSDSAYITTTWPDSRENSYKHKNGKPPAYSLWYDSNCDQITHAIKHYPEIGHKVLPKQTVAALDYMYREIGEWVKDRQYFKAHPQQHQARPRKGYPKLHETAKIVQLVGDALKLADAGERNVALCKIARDGYGITPWHDGSTNCQYPAKNK